MRIFIVLGILSLLAACSPTEQASETGQTPKSTAPIDKAQETTVSEGKALYPEAAVLQFQGGLPDKTDLDWKSKVSEPAMMPRVGVVQGINMMASLPLACLIPSQAC